MMDLIANPMKSLSTTMKFITNTKTFQKPTVMLLATKTKMMTKNLEMTQMLKMTN